MAFLTTRGAVIIVGFLQLFTDKPSLPWPTPKRIGTVAVQEVPPRRPGSCPKNGWDGFQVWR
eukprot:10498813-Lingulodinium_polyedra.AAC.1